MWRGIEFVVFILLSLQHCQAIRMKEQITITLSEPKQYCTRLLNGTTSAGCQSDENGNMGVATLVAQPSDIAEAINSLPFGISKIVAIVEAENFTRRLIDTILNEDAVVGVLLIAPENFFPSTFSEDSACPNENFYVRTKLELQTCQWNKEGALHPNGFMFLSLDKPFFVLSDEKDIDLVVNKCYKAFNRDERSDRRCVVRAVQFMNAAGNAEICRRRQALRENNLFSLPAAPICEPLHDYNLLAALPPQSSLNISGPANVLMLAARMDMATIFAGSHGGDVSTLSSLIALLAVADAIGRNLQIFQELATRNNRQLLLSFFHGESMGYIGSGRAVWEMEHGRFPASSNQFPQASANVRQIGLDDLWAYVEVQQLRASENFHLHSSFDVYARNSTLIDGLVNSIREPLSQQGYGVNFLKKKSVPFPPSSYHSILRKTTKVPGLLLSGFSDSYESGTINSLADLEISQNLQGRSQAMRYISAAANALLKMTIDHVVASSNSTRTFLIDENYVGELMDCFYYSNNWDCQLFHTILDVKKMPSNARHLFIGTAGDSIIRYVVLSLLVRSLGEKAPVQNVDTKSQCKDLNKNQNVYRYEWQNDTETTEECCFKTSIYYTHAKSPAFLDDSYDFQSGEYSTWMQSTWLISPLELYLKPDLSLDAYAALTALIVLIASIPLKLFMRESWFIDSHEPPSSPHRL